MDDVNLQRSDAKRRTPTATRAHVAAERHEWQVFLSGTRDDAAGTFTLHAAILLSGGPIEVMVRSGSAPEAISNEAKEAVQAVLDAFFAQIAPDDPTAAIAPATRAQFALVVT